jgi:hypothetical protein
MMIDWLFRDRTTGRLTIAQRPNAPLIVFLAAVALRWTVRPTGTSGAVVYGVGLAGLLVWSGDEVIRGVNPWRRLLGGGVLAAIVVDLVTR